MKKNYGKTTTISIFKDMKESCNPVTKCVLREILIKRFERGDHEK